MTIPDEIKRLKAEADRLHQNFSILSDDGDAWETLWQAVNDLDRRAGPGLAIGRQLQFHAGDGIDTYLIEDIEDLRVRCVHLPSADGCQAEAVDTDGWCLRSIAEAQCTRHDAAHGVRP